MNRFSHRVLFSKPPPSAWAACAVAAACAASAGCGGAPAVDPDTPALLKHLQFDSRRHDPVDFAEVPLGDYQITRKAPNSNEIIHARFTLVGVTPKKHQEALTKAVEQRRQRMRDAVLAVARRAEPKHLGLADFGWLKAELIPTINQALHSQELRDVVFSEFTLEKG